MTSTSIPMLMLSAGSLEQYIESVRRIRLLSAQEERDLAVRWRREGDVEAARDLVLSHLPLVVSVARGFLNYGLPHADLIQEGNVGLMKAVTRFDPGRGIRLAGYAARWIRAEIQAYVMQNWRLVKAATTRATRKLFFRLRKAKAQLEWLSDRKTDALSRELDVAPGALRKMETYLYGTDVALPPDEEFDSGGGLSLQETTDVPREPCGILELQQWEAYRLALLYGALATLDERSREIIQRRWLSEDKLTLLRLAEQFGFTPERVRQLETRAMRQLASRMQLGLLNRS